MFRPKKRAHPSRTTWLGFRPRVEGLEDRDVPATFSVTDGGDSGPGTLRQAIIDAQQILADADEIVITQGVTEIILQSALPTLLETHTIRSEAVGGTFIHPDDPVQFTFRFARVIPNGAVLTIENLHLAGFGADGDGGAILADGDLNLTSCVIEGCQATGNGGAISLGRSLTMTSCALFGNTAGGNGGAIHSVSTAGPVWHINSSSITSNTAGGGGGAIYFHTTDVGQLFSLQTYYGSNQALGGHGGAICQINGFLDVRYAPSMGFPGGFIANFASGMGGGIFITSAYRVYLDAYGNGNLGHVPDENGNWYPIPNDIYVHHPRPGAEISINTARLTGGAIIDP